MSNRDRGKVKRNIFASRVTDTRNNLFGFAQDGVIYTFSDESDVYGDAWLRMQRAEERGKNRRKYLLFFADETEPCAFVDRYNNVYDLENDYIATLEPPRFTAALLAILGVVLILSGIFVYLAGQVLMQTAAPMSEDNTVNLNIADAASPWTEDKDFDIFGVYNKNGETINSRDGEKLIYPGLSGEYQFLIKNVNDVSVYYRIYFSDENEGGIPMRFRLRQGNHYIAGDPETFVGIDDLKTLPVRLGAEEDEVYTLEWLWLESDDEYDTQLGISAAAKYIFTVRVNFESV